MKMISLRLALLEHQDTFRQSNFPILFVRYGCNEIHLFHTGWFYFPCEMKFLQCFFGLFDEQIGEGDASDY